MKRTLILLILLVLVAAVINIATAVGFWFFGERPPSPSVDGPYGIVDLRPQELAVWRDKRDSDWPQEPEVASMYKYFGITYRSLMWIEIEWSGSEDDPASKVTNRDSYLIEIVEIGWPMRFIAGEQWKEWHGLNAKQQFTSGMSQAFGYQWPNRLFWSGMFINVLFYCALIVLARLSWIYIPRAIRRKRGCCLKCTYDLRGDYSTGCPECGYGREQA